MDGSSLGHEYGGNRVLQRGSFRRYVNHELKRRDH